MSKARVALLAGALAAVGGVASTCALLRREPASAAEMRRVIAASLPLGSSGEQVVAFLRAHRMEVDAQPGVLFGRLNHPATLGTLVAHDVAVEFHLDSRGRLRRYSAKDWYTGL